MDNGQDVSANGLGRSNDCARRTMWCVTRGRDFVCRRIASRRIVPSRSDSLKLLRGRTRASGESEMHTPTHFSAAISLRFYLEAYISARSVRVPGVYVFKGFPPWRRVNGTRRLSCVLFCLRF